MSLILQNMGVDRRIPLVKWINVCGREHIISGRKRTISSRRTRAGDSCPIFLDPECGSSGAIIMLRMLSEVMVYIVFRQLILTMEIRSQTAVTVTAIYIEKERNSCENTSNQETLTS